MSQLDGQRVPQAFFLATNQGSRYCLFHRPPQGQVHRRPVLYLHPFAEELNTTRRVVAQQARAMAAAGHPVLQMDLLGCGDSEGDFTDATWSAWLRDACRAYDWLRENCDGEPWLWGFRAGALLTGALMESLPTTHDLIWWQPMLSGATQLQQFLRLGLAQQWTRSDQAIPTNASQRLRAGESVEIAGYTLSPQLAAELDAARLEPALGGAARRLIWIDIASQPLNAPNLKAQALRDAWVAAGWRVEHCTITAPAFWQTMGLEDAPVLVEATLDALSAADAGSPQ